jgi:hypothetical protein
VFARTAIGVASSGVMYLVADGEGVSGGNGATGNQLGHFFRDVLGATAAMALDSGLSTEMILKGAIGLRHVNTITGEDAQIQTYPARETFESLGLEQSGGIGSVANFSWSKVRSYNKLANRLERSGVARDALRASHAALIDRQGTHAGRDVVDRGASRNQGMSQGQAAAKRRGGLVDAGGRCGRGQIVRAIRGTACVRADHVIAQ